VSDHDRPTFDAALLAGAALFGAGEYHAAHDPWEARWLGAEGAERHLLQGLIQATAAVFHAREGNPDGARGLAEGACGYLDSAGGSEPAGRVELDPLRAYLEALAADPVLEREPPVLRVDGEPVRFEELRFEAVALAAGAIAEEYGLDEKLVERAAAYGRADLDRGVASSPFVTLLVAVASGDGRAVALERLAGHVSRRRNREEDVEGLFE
jgi:hypothetical protein